jgi:hypothetical protein
MSTAQVYDYKLNTKPHFRVVNLDSCTNKDFLQQAAFEFSGYDSLRLVSTRRTIPVAGTSVAIELFSGQELLELYGKEISPVNIPVGQLIRDYEFVFVESKAPILTVKPTQN